MDSNVFRLNALSLLALVGGCSLSIQAAEPPSKAKADEIPAISQRPAVVRLDAAGVSKMGAGKPAAQLAEGYELDVVAGAPLVTHPIMGCLDDKGRLFVGDAVGVNWNKAQLDANPPNRVLLLEDTNHDGVFDKSTVFADRMTFPQGACWLNGSLYVCSPPGLWKLTDTDGDGVADKREMLVSGFDYTGNAADIHGPFLHPNGRLYWCHGRKGHKAVGKEGHVVHEGLASGIWSCSPDGSDVQWHSLGCGDNPVKVDFTPDGDILGVQNLYYSNPRGDTLVHWLYGGVYERADMLKAIEGAPRTLETMPVVHNFGHVAVSGSCFWRKFPAGGAGGAMQFMVTHFNTQRLVRMEVTQKGSSYQATENEFLKLEDPDIHLTDVMESGDGSLLLLNTGGWFRSGCPASLMAKPDITGAVYRIRRTGSHAPIGGVTPVSLARAGDPLAGLASADPHARRLACEVIARTKVSSEKLRVALLALLAQPLDAALEHAAIFAAVASGMVGPEETASAQSPLLLRRLLAITEQRKEQPLALAANASQAAKHLDSMDTDLARVALGVVTRSLQAAESLSPLLAGWLGAERVSAPRLRALEGFATALLAKPETQGLVTQMLGHSSSEVRKCALGILAGQTAGVSQEAWVEPLEKAFADPSTSRSLVVDAIKKLKNSRFDDALQALANDPKQPLSLRLRALSAVKSLTLVPETFALLKAVLADPGAAAAAHIQAATLLKNAPLKREEFASLAAVFGQVGPVELKELLPLFAKSKDAGLAREFALALAKNPAIASQQESVYRTALSSYPADIFEAVVLPALRVATEASEAKKRLLGPWAEKVAMRGEAPAGRLLFESGRGTCIACHQIGGKGRAIGPDLSKIGAIRTERDLLESIIFPSNTLARDYETHVLETADGQTIMGVIRSHTAEGLLVVDFAGQEKNIPHPQIVSDTPLPTSLMPMGLDSTLSEAELLNLVAWLRSLK